MPYVRVTVVSYDPARQEEIARFAEEQFEPKLRQLPGFRRWTAAGDGAGHTVTTSEWDTLEQASAGAMSVLGLTQSLVDLGVRQEVLYVYEVLTQFWRRRRCQGVDGAGLKASATHTGSQAVPVRIGTGGHHVAAELTVTFGLRSPPAARPAAGGHGPRQTAHQHGRRRANGAAVRRPAPAPLHIDWMSPRPAAGCSASRCRPAWLPPTLSAAARGRSQPTTAARISPGSA
jgi:hypothetical protein